MPRTIKDILDHADELAKRFEDYEPSATDERDPAVFAELRRAVLSRSDAERSIRDAVKHARERGYSWAFIGSLVGTSVEAARQRYGHKQDALANGLGSVWISRRHADTFDTLRRDRCLSKEPSARSAVQACVCRLQHAAARHRD